MKTEIFDIDGENIDYSLLEKAAEILKRGGLVVFPTETVYGLGAAAACSEAVKNIFKAKGRPSDNPLIVHISDFDMIKELISDEKTLENQDIKKLAQNFWPGPLTIIFRKNNSLCDEVTAGLDTVGIRMPENIVARELIRLTGKGVAAPSANTSGRPSPTEPRHVIEDMYGKVDAIICSGNCAVGVESTVLDMTCDPPVILRPGGVTRESIKELLGKDILMAGVIKNDEGQDFVPKAPGMKYRHYAPKGKVIVFSGEDEKIAEKINKYFSEALNEGKIPRIVASRQTARYYDEKYVTVFGDKECPETFAAGIFSALRECDRYNADIIFAEAVSQEGIGEAVMNRLLKAAGNNIIYV